MNALARAEEYLASKGIEVEAKKSTFQVNTEFSMMLLTLLMSEMDALRARIEVLEGMQSE